MSTTKLLMLGAIAGGTIFLGLPVGRLHQMTVRARALLNAVAIGILVFLLAEVLTAGFEGVEHALEEAVDGAAGWGGFAGRLPVFFGGVGLGLLTLVWYDRWLDRRGPARPDGPGAAAAGALATGPVRITAAQRLALFIALGIGLHNFSEGLAIGQSAASGEVSLAVLLVVGFALHNATEGFGIIGPLAQESELPSWSFLGLLGLIGGGPTFLGTIVGRSFVNETLSIGFLALAGGSILYVVIQLVTVGVRLGHKELLFRGALVGLVLGYGTDLVLVAAGA